MRWERFLQGLWEDYTPSMLTRERERDLICGLKFRSNYYYAKHVDNGHIIVGLLLSKLVQEANMLQVIPLCLFTHFV